MGSSDGAPAFPGRGWAGIAALAAAAVAVYWQAPSGASILGWWGLALMLDAACWKWRRRSALEQAPEAVVWMAVLSIFLVGGLDWAGAWLGAWAYLGLPANELLRYAVQGATFAAYLPALHAAAILFGADGASAALSSLALRLALGVVLVAAALALGSDRPEQVPLMAPPGVLLAGVWLLCSGANALRGHAEASASAWLWAGLLLLGWSWALTELTGQGRYPGGYVSPGPWQYPLLAALGPAMRAAYLLLADSADLPRWPFRESRTSLIR